MAASSRPEPHLRYRYPPALMMRVACALVCGRRRSFVADAGLLARTLQPPPRAKGLGHVPPTGRLVIVFNHYYSRRFPSWWCAIVLASLIHARRAPGANGMAWVMTGAWTYPDRLRSLLLTPLSGCLFRRIAGVYGFVAMPPMPPRPHEVEGRARAVRQLLTIARGPQPPLIGLSPEGHDGPHAQLMVPPHGVGRLLLHLGASGYSLLPAGVYEQGSELMVRFGPTFRLCLPGGLPRDADDCWAAAQVMLAIGRLLPPELWGAYSGPLAGGAGDHFDPRPISARRRVERAAESQPGAQVRRLIT